MAERPFDYGDAYGMTPSLYDTAERNPRGALPSRGSFMRGIALVPLVVSTFIFSYLEDAGTGLGVLMAQVSQAIVALLAIYLLVINVATGSRLILTTEYVLFGAFFLWCLMGMPFSISTEFSSRAIITLAKLLFMALVVLNAVNGRQTYQWLLVSIALALLVMSFGAVTGLARGAEIVGSGYRRYSGTFGNANEAGNLACLGVWAAFSLFLVTRSRILKPLFLGILAWGIVVVGWTASKGALLGLAAGTVGAYWFVLRKSSRGWGGKIGWLILIAAFFGGMAAYFATTYVGERMQAFFETVQTGRGDRSDRFRLQLLVNSFEILADNPFFGVGFGCSSLVVSTGESFRSGHNTIGTIGAETGVLGWLLFFGAWFAVMNRLRRIGKFPIPLTDYKLAMAGWVLFVMLGVWTFVGEMAKFKPFWICFAGLTAYLAWVERTWREHQEPAASEYSSWSPSAAPRS